MEQTPQNIGIFLPNWVGDTVMATPTLRAVRKRFPPPHRLTGIMRPKMAELLAGTDWLDEYWFWEPKLIRGPWSQLKLIGRMRKTRIDLLILLPNSLRSALLAFLGGAKKRVGYARDGRNWLLTTKVYPPRRGGKIVPQPMVQAYLALAEAAGCPPASPRLELRLTEEERHLGEAIWRQLGLEAHRPVVAIVYAGAQGPARRWPEEHCAQLARLITQFTPCQVLIFCGPDHGEEARRIVSRAACSRVKSLGEIPNGGLAVAKACLERAALVVSPDSGPRHVAAAFGKPLITLYGPTTPIWGENPEVRSVNLWTDLPCRGCTQGICPLGHHRCMRDLLPEKVFEHVLTLLERIREVRAA